MQHLLNAVIFSGFGELVRSLGGNTEALLSRFGIPLDIESKNDAYVPLANAAMLLEYCAKELDCPDFGLRLSQLQGLSILGPVAVLARNAQTVDAAARSIGEYLHLITPAVSVRFEVKMSENCIRSIFEVHEVGLLPTRQLYELYVGNGQLIIQMLVGSQVFAERMYFPHKRIAPEQSYRSLFRCHVQFNQEHCAVDVPIAVMQQRLEQADQETARIASNYLSDRYGGKPASLNEQIAHLIQRLLPTGYCKINTVAEHLGMHPRTLQRRLSLEHDATFESMVDAQRKALAKRYLAESKLRLTQVSGLLGYADQSALNRSCRRWFNQTPRAIRKQWNQSSGDEQL